MSRLSIVARLCAPVALLASVTGAQQPDAGIVRFRHYGVNQDDKHVFEGERTVLIKRRSHWGDK